jgi:hypothetical protein
MMTVHHECGVNANKSDRFKVSLLPTAYKGDV